MAKTHVGCVTIPVTGGSGVEGCGLMVLFPEEEEVHPDEFVTVNEYVPGTNPLMVVLVPVPLVITPSGDLVRFHVPVAGSPLRVMLPVATVQEV